MEVQIEQLNQVEATVRQQDELSSILVSKPGEMRERYFPSSKLLWTIYVVAGS